MLMKRFYDKTDPNNPRVAGVTVKHTGLRREQNFSSKLVAQAIEQGWMSIGRGAVTIHAKDGDLVYAIERGSGVYCCHCTQALGDWKTAQAHVAAAHPGKPSPDTNNPSGYRKVDGYECLLAEESQKKFGLKKKGGFIG